MNALPAGFTCGVVTLLNIIVLLMALIFGLVGEFLGIHNITITNM